MGILCRQAHRLACECTRHRVEKSTCRTPGAARTHPPGTTQPLAVGSQSERACGQPIETIFHDSRTIHMVVQQVVARAPAGHQPAGPAFPTFLRIITDTARTAQALSFVVAAALRLRSTPHGVDAENMAPLCVLAHSPCWLHCCECLRALSGPGHMAAHRKRRLRTAVTAVRPRRASFCSHTALSGCDSH